jgi:N-acyl-D-amino-acid deacylase
MQAGALGLATGLEYDPGIYSDAAEVLALAHEAASGGGRYISHIRSEDRHFWEALEELLEIGRQTRMPVQVSHLKLAMKSLWGSAGELLRLLEDARGEGIDVTADVYPYTFWQSTMTVLFPERDFDNRESAAFALEELAPPDGIWIARFDADPTYVGMTLTEIAELRDTDPVTTYLDLLAEAEAAASDPDNWGESIIATSMDEADIADLIAWPNTNICSDGGLAGHHPRGFGAFTRVLKQYVREEERLSWEQAIHKMTGLAASHMGLQNRGTLQAGAWADLVLLDPDLVSDRATPDDPQAVSSGIEKVWVNGELAWDGGEITGARPGKALRRSVNQ